MAYGVIIVQGQDKVRYVLESIYIQGILVKNVIKIGPLKKKNVRTSIFRKIYGS